MSEHIRVKSSQIHSWRYDGDRQRLETRFLHKKCGGEGCESCNNTGHTGSYEYSSVPPEVWAQLQAAESKGSAHHLLVRKAKYPFVFSPHGA